MDVEVVLRRASARCYVASYDGMLLGAVRRSTDGSWGAQFLGKPVAREVSFSLAASKFYNAVRAWSVSHRAGA